MKIIIPKRWIPDEEIVGPLFFLAGPIRGGGDWQSYMCTQLWGWQRECTVACPCRWEEPHHLGTMFVPPDAEPRFKRQLEWERYYLERAGSGDRQGCIIFWLGCESREFPHLGPEPYAMDTRGELGEWRWRMKTENARVVIGADPGFFGLSQIQRNFSQALGYDFPIYQTISETVHAAIALAG